MAPFTPALAYYLNVERYVFSLPLRRRLLARFFKRFKVTKEEYDAWFYSFTNKNN